MWKKSGLILVFSLVFFLGRAFAEEVCIKHGTENKMTYATAYAAALKSDCIKVGKLKEGHWCNATTGTWWIYLKTKMKGCSPACVINVVDGVASVNYMCTGLLRTQKN